MNTYSDLFEKINEQETPEAGLLKVICVGIRIEKL